MDKPILNYAQRGTPRDRPPSQWLPNICMILTIIVCLFAIYDAMTASQYAKTMNAPANVRNYNSSVVKRANEYAASARWFATSVCSILVSAWILYGVYRS